MTQKHIRRRARVPWYKRAWMQLHEPRVVSATYGAVYFVAVIVGSISMFNPPRTIEAAAGDVLMAIIASLITLGGVIGVVTVAKGVYWIERYAAALMILGSAAYLAMALFLQVTTSGNRLLQAGAILAAGCFFGVRYWWINDRPYNPRKKRTRPQHT